jgi:glycerol-3-phosphate O-acyltransferase
MDHFEKLIQYRETGQISPHLASIIYDFYLSYGDATSENGYSIDSLQDILIKFLDLVIEQLKQPYLFELYHQHIVKPFNYYQFGLELIRPLILFAKSTLLGMNHLNTIQKLLEQGDNIILFGNHQTEPDPQAISLLLEKSHPQIGEEMIFVAGHRVTTDPLAIPFSIGRNLLCIFSKRYIETNPALKEEKLLHNQRTMNKMSQLLSVGGKCIYIAPSGGRDRLNAEGAVEIAPFDPQSIEMCWLMAKKSGRSTHCFPLALSTYLLLPPPSRVQKKLGERRHAHCTPIHLAFGPEIDMENFSGSKDVERKKLRLKRAEYILSLVKNDYEKFPQ